MYISIPIYIMVTSSVRLWQRLYKWRLQGNFKTFQLTYICIYTYAVLILKGIYAHILLILHYICAKINAKALYSYNKCGWLFVSCYILGHLCQQDFKIQFFTAIQLGCRYLKTIFRFGFKFNNKKKNIMAVVKLQ